MRIFALSLLSSAALCGAAQAQTAPGLSGATTIVSNEIAVNRSVSANFAVTGAQIRAVRDAQAAQAAALAAQSNAGVQSANALPNTSAIQSGAFPSMSGLIPSVTTGAVTDSTVIYSYNLQFGDGNDARNENAVEIARLLESAREDAAASDAPAED